MISRRVQHELHRGAGFPNGTVPGDPAGSPRPEQPGWGVAGLLQAQASRRDLVAPASAATGTLPCGRVLGRMSPA